MAEDFCFWDLRRTAWSLSRRARTQNPLPPLLMFTDPARTPDPVAAAAALPPGAAVIYRPFGDPQAPAVARDLRRVTRARRIKLMIGADIALALAVGADGVHLPERQAHRARALRLAHPQWIVTAAAHSLPAARRGLALGAQAVVVSVVFPSRSPSAGRPMGARGLAVLARAAGGPVYGLGGINTKNARRLLASGVVGLAAVEGLSPG
ncbi:thiamine phosphate synthase [Phenylobacterium sp.]|uniref:thiamine phosphate synthase n=1 Tax=Phenylobacterium sp. TaxID=1871053 RepID=UPI0027312F40|nr:thiamine phosphate synthase [Phenylobacterium sp.]MDP1616221.1 thiamine phosphate synthase [Phenylobacterium sp.]MDP1988774.1 thiamine phosphate synthase [Phenylobacterium sp.]